MPGLFDKTVGGLVRGVGAVPDFRPAEDRQRGARQSAAGGLGQVELAAAILVGLVARRAEIQGQGDVAVERQQAILHFIGLLDHLQRVAGVALEPLIPDQQASPGADSEGQRQADIQRLFRT